MFPRRRSDDVDRFRAVLATPALRAVGAAPHAVELLGGGFHKGWLIGEDAGFEVAAVAAFHSYSGSGQVGGADIGCLKVEG